MYIIRVCLQQMVELTFISLFRLANIIYYIIKTQQSKYIKLKEADRGKRSLSKLTGSGSGKISTRIRIFLKFLIRILDLVDH